MSPSTAGLGVEIRLSPADCPSPLARMEQSLFHVQELVYEKLRGKLEEDDLDWRAMDLINLSRVMTESYSAIKKARSVEDPDPKGKLEPLTEEEYNEYFGTGPCPDCGSNEGQEEAGKYAG